jgi:beta-glucosidase-like glycosyl hydrolase
MNQLDNPEHRALARVVAEESFVLLKRKRLPIDVLSISSIAVIGPNANNADNVSILVVK